MTHVRDERPAAARATRPRRSASWSGASPCASRPRTRSCASCTARPRASAGIPRPTSRGAGSIRRPIRRRCARRRAWCGAAGRGAPIPGLGENTALLIRFCLESGAAGMDAKLFLSFRPAEEAKHLEACFLFARRLGGYESTPAAAVARASNQPFAQMALDPDVSVEAVVGRARRPRRPARPQPVPLPPPAQPRRDRAPDPAADRRRQAAPRALRVDAPRRPAAARSTRPAAPPWAGGSRYAGARDPRRLPEHVAAARGEPRAAARRGGPHRASTAWAPPPWRRRRRWCAPPSPRCGSASPRGTSRWLTSIIPSSGRA